MGCACVTAAHACVDVHRPINRTAPKPELSFVIEQLNHAANVALGARVTQYSIIISLEAPVNFREHSKIQSRSVDLFENKTIIDHDSSLGLLS